MDMAREKELKKQKALEKAAKLQAQQTSTNRKKSEKKMVKRGGKEENSEDFFDPETPFGEKKRLSSQMAKQYSPTAVEKSIFILDFADLGGMHGERNLGSLLQMRRAPNPHLLSSFILQILPPPNVTGALHIGHALTAAVEDTIICWRRMSGYNTLWVPGMDHAGIATQVVVEKKIIRERKLTRHDIGREKFISEVWDWKNKYGGTILQQLRCLGASLDWSCECFTMDEKRSRAVTEAFVRLYKEELVYRGEHLVNWDCVLRTAISDIEVEHIEIKERTLLNVPGYEKPVEFGVLTSFAYPLEGELGEIVVATTRVETMLGDTAIAIHPDDPRYNHLHGKFAIHPSNGRKLPIVCDATLVDPKFGTGAVKVTPAHDLNDFEFKECHNCESINIFTDDGKINSSGGSEFAGMPRFKAREAVIESLQKKGLYRGAKGNDMRLGICSRTNDVVEPLSKPQWYVKCNSMERQALTNDVVEPLSKPQGCVKCDSMARQALNAVEDKKIEIIPKQYAADWKRWLENIRDWCVSRQLWWGHRVLAWYVTLEDDELKELGAYNDRDHWVVARNEDEA
uniref:valine--tRNA ligase n=1 Tax=Quercus lobata TaxID=97700 RepID=A0A7N2N037_QUELO